MSSIEVLFEDNHIIAVNKKPGDIVQGDKTGDIPLSEIVKKYIKEKYHKPGDVFLGTVHRIDRPVSGVVLYARTGKALERLNKLFREKEIAKTYWAVVKNLPAQPSGNLVNYLVKNEQRNKSRICEAGTKGALKAELAYRLLASTDNYHLLEITPLTGRHHQIRVQLASIGCPIKGDVKYGFARTNSDGSIHLHARKVAFTHPVKDEPVVITAPPPHDAVWDACVQVLS